MPNRPLTHFVANAPEMVVKDGLLHVGPGPLGHTMVVPLSMARRAHIQLGAVLAEYDRRPDPVVPLCELCISRDLPRDRH
jgi:hypothetical protein